MRDRRGLGLPGESRSRAVRLNCREVDLRFAQRAEERGQRWLPVVTEHLQREARQVHVLIRLHAAQEGRAESIVDLLRQQSRQEFGRASLVRAPLLPAKGSGPSDITIDRLL